MRRLLLFALICGPAVGLLIQCTSLEGTSENVTAENDSTKVRLEEVGDGLAEVQKCAGCHREEYDSWLKGPHANSYRTLIEHVEYVKSSPSFSQDYKALVPTILSTVCMPCHAGKNLYETSLVGVASESDPKRFSTEFFPHLFDEVLGRDQGDLKNLSTGVDCMTCHSQGAKNVTNGSSASKGQPGSCDLIKSKYFESNQNCYSCHHHQVSTMDRLVKQKRLESEANCVDCHQQYDTEGNGTHYFFWRRDPSDVVRPDRLNIYKNIGVEVVKSGGGWVAEVNWLNDFVPHDFSECGEAVLRIEIVDRGGATVGHSEIRLNRRAQMSSLPPPHFREGSAGSEFIFKGRPAISSFEVSGDATGGEARVTGLVKPQYWSADEELKEVSSLTIEL